MPGYVRFLAGLAALVLILAAVDFILFLKERAARLAASPKKPQTADPRP
jgi:hypothetical protein